MFWEGGCDQHRTPNHALQTDVDLLWESIFAISALKFGNLLAREGMLVIEFHYTRTRVVFGARGQTGTRICRRQTDNSVRNIDLIS